MTLSNALADVKNLGVVSYNGQIVVSSRDVAAVFEKEHYKVMRSIKTLGCSPNFTAANFGVSEYKDATGRTLPQYLMTKDGFVILAMSFTGKKAMAFKEAYIAEFNRMRECLEGGPKIKKKALPAAWDTGMTATMVSRFIDECCIRDRNGLVSRREFYNYFISWCDAKRLPYPSQCIVSRAVASLRCCQYRKSDIRFWCGLSIKIEKFTS